MAKQLNKSHGSGGNQLKYSIIFDTNKTTLNDLKTSLIELQKMTSSELMNLNKGMNLNEANAQLKEMRAMATSLRQALNNSFNKDLGTTNITKLNAELGKTGYSIQTIADTFAMAGEKGRAAFRNLATEALTSEKQLKKNHNLIQDMANTMANTVKWGIASSAMNNFTGSVQKAYSFVRQLDSSLNNIMIVTNKSSDDMAKFAKQANDAAKALGAQTTTYTDAALIYYQQGLSEEETKARAETTVKTANVTGQTGDQVSEELTAVWNGYKVNAEETEIYVDKLAKVAAGTAANLEELSTGMSKVASAANTAGVDVDQLNATLATVISVTREAPETIGTAFKTIYARMGDLSLNGADEYGVSLGTVSGQLHDLGIELLDEQGNMRDMGDVIEDTAAKWDTWTSAQKQAAAVAMAGKMQYSRLISLFENWDMYEDALSMSKNSLGELQKEQDVYMESTQAHIEKMRASFEGLYNSLLDGDSINLVTDAVSGLVQQLTNVVDIIGGGSGALLNLGAVATRVFSKQISQGATTAIQNIKSLVSNTQDAKTQFSLLKIFDSLDYQDENFTEILDTIKEFQQYSNVMSDEDANLIANLVKAKNEIINQKAAWEDNLAAAKKYYEESTNHKFDNSEAETKSTGKGSQTQAVQEIANKYKNTEKTSQAIKQHIKEISILSNDVSEPVEKTEDAYDNLGESVIEVINQTKDYLSLSAKGSTYYDSLVELKKLQDEILDSGILIEKVKKDKNGNEKTTTSVDMDATPEQLEALEEYAEKGTAIYSQMSQEATKHANVIKNNANGMGKAIEDMGTQSEEGLKKAKDSLDLTAKIDNIITLTGSVGQLIASLNTLKGIGEIWSDDTLSSGDKFIQTLEGAAVLVPQVLIGAAGITETLPMIATQLGAVSTTAGATATMADIMWTSLLGPAAAVVAAVAAVGVGIWALSEAYNADAKEAERAAEASRDLASAADDAQTELDNLQGIFDNYKTAKEQLDSCTEGTQEWTDALKEANSAAMSLLDNIDNLSADQLKELYTRDQSTGEIQINQDKVQDYAIQSKQNKVYAANIASASGDLYAIQQQAESDILDTVRDGIDSFTVVATALVNPLGLFALGLKEAQSQFEKSQIMDHLDEFSEGLTLDEFKQKAQELGVDLSSLSDNQLEDFKTQVENAAQSAEKASEKLDMIAQLQVEDKLGDKYNKTTKKIAANQVRSRTTEIKAEYQKKYLDDGLTRFSGRKNDNYKTILEDLQAAGYNWTAGNKNVVRGGKGNRELYFKDENDEEVHKSEDWIAQTVAANKALAEMTGNAEKASKALNTLDQNVGDEVSEGIKDFINNGNFENMSQSDFETMKSEVGNDPSKYLSEKMGVSEKELKTMLGQNYEQKFLDKIKDYSTSFKKYTKNFNDDTKDAIKGLDNLSNLSIAQQKQIAQTLETARKATPESTDLMNNILEGYKSVDSDQLEGFSNVVSGIKDWSDISVQDLKKTLDEANVSTNMTDEALQSFINSMNKATAATKDWSSLRTTYREIHDIIDDLENGNKISKDNYEKLGVVAEDYFQQMLDGTYELVGSALDLKDVIEKTQLSKFAENLSDEKQQISKMQDLQVVKEYDEDYFSKVSQNQDPSVMKNKNGKSFSFSANNSDVDQDMVKQQLDLLSTLDSGNDKLAQWNTEWRKFNEENAPMSSKSLKEISEAVQACKDKYDDLNGTLKEAQAQLLTNEIIMLSSADSLRDMKDIANEYNLSQEAFGVAANQLYEKKQWDDIDTEQVETYAESLQDVAKDSKELADSLETDKKAARDLAREVVRMDQGIDELADNWKDWSDILKKSSKTSEEYAQAMKSTKEALADVLDTSEDYISNDFVNKHLEEIGKAATGDAEAIDSLHDALAKQIIVDIAVDNGLDKEGQNELLNDLNTLQSQLPSLDVGASIDTSSLEGDQAKFEETLANMVEKSNMTQDQVNALLGQMGYEADFETEPATIETKVPVTVTDTDSEITSIFPPKMHSTSKTYQNGTQTIKQSVDIPKITSKNGKKTLGLSNLRKKATGSMNNYSAKNSGGKSPGSGSGSKKEPSKKDLNEDVKDRYEKVNVQLEKIEANLKKVQSQEDKLMGQKLIDNLNKQLTILNQKIDKTNEKLKIAHQEQAELQRTLSGYGIGFDSEGVMTNYAEVFNRQQAALNSIYNHYNSLSADAQEGYEATVTAAEKRWEKFKDAVSDYDNLIGSTIPGLEQDIQDTMNEKLEIQIKEFDMSIDLSLDIKDAQDKWNDFKKKIIKDLKDTDILGNALDSLDRFADYYNEQGLGVIQQEVDHLNKLMGEVDKYNNTGWSTVYGDDQSSMMEDLKKYYEQAMDDLESVKDLIDDIHDKMNETLEDIADQMDDQMNYYEAINDTLDHDMQLVQLVYGEEAYDRLALYYEQMEKNLNGQLEFQKASVDFWQAQMDSLEKGSEEWKTAKENWLNAVKDWQGSVETAIENLSNKYLNTINEIFQELNNKVTNGNGLDYMNTEWELIKKNADEYLDTINTAYGIQQLQNKYLDAIDSTKSITAQQKLNKLMKEQINALKQQDKLTQYDLDRAELKYQIAVKRIALEEAQQNKSTMRLRRDSQGNYSYQYVADEDQVSKAQQEVSDLYNQLYNLDVDQYQSNLDKVYEIWAEYQEKMKEAAQINDAEARLKKEQLLTEQYGQLINGLVSQNETIKQGLYESTFLELEDLYGKQSETVENFLQNQDDMMSLLIAGWSSGLQEMADEIKKEGGFEATYEESLEKIKESTQQYEEELKNLQDIANVSFDSLGKDVDDVQNKIQSLTGDTNSLINKFTQEVQSIQDVMNQIDALNDMYQRQSNAIQTVVNAYNKYIQAMNNARNAATQASNSVSGNGGSGNSGSSNGGNSGSSSPYAGYPLGGQTYTVVRGDNLWNIAKKKYGNASQWPTIYNNNRSVIGGNPNRIYPGQVLRLDTGGYTGAWGTEGRMAMLHEKELVLNKKDTENMLNAVEILRNITSTLDTNMLARLANISASSYNGIGESSPLQQEVHIDATFPNVSNHNEIEDALNNLVNAAAQRVGKKR